MSVKVRKDSEPSGRHFLITRLTIRVSSGVSMEQCQKQDLEVKLLDRDRSYFCLNPEVLFVPLMLEASVNCG